MSKFWSNIKCPKLCQRKPVEDDDDADAENRNRNKSKFWSNIKWPNLCKRTEEVEDENLGRDSNASIIPEDEDDESVTGWRRWLTLRNIVFGFAVLDLTVSFVCGCYFLTFYILMSQENLNTVDSTRHIEVDYTAASFCGLFVLISIVLIVAVIKFVSILGWVWLLLSTLIYIIMCLSYLTRIASWDLMGYKAMTGIFIITSIYKFIQDLFVHRWIKALRFRVRPLPSVEDVDTPEEIEDPDVEPVNPMLTENILGSSSSESEEVPEVESEHILVHPLHNAPYQEYLGYGPRNAEGGLFDFGRRQPRYRSELPRAPDAIDTDSDL